MTLHKEVVRKREKIKKKYWRKHLPKEKKKPQRPDHSQGISQKENGRGKEERGFSRKADRVRRKLLTKIVEKY